ncbi:MAG: GntR family transcriptional regulator [Planctomycetota bacterium]
MLHSTADIPAYSTHLLTLSSKQFPSRRAAYQLRAELVQLLRSGKLAAGEPFPTDDELAELTRLSRSTVRRAVSTLASDGWIERQAGRGSFVGSRAASEEPSTNGNGHTPVASHEVERAPASARRWRVGVLSFWDVDDQLAGHWFTPTVLDGLAQASTEQAFSVEMLPTNTVSAVPTMRSLDEHPPDAIISLSAYAAGNMVLAHAQLHGLQAVGVGTTYLDTDVHVVCEDNAQGMKLAVDRLVEAGHRKIGFVVQRAPALWVFERHEAFEDRLRTHGVDADGTNIFWLPRDRPDDFARGDYGIRFKQWVQRNGWTAIISGNLGALHFLGDLQRAGRIRVPDELSLVTFDQVPSAALWLGGVQPDTVEIPLREMGLRAASVLGRLRSGDHERIVERVPCTLSTGSSVQQPNSSQKTNRASL